MKQLTGPSVCSAKVIKLLICSSSCVYSLLVCFKIDKTISKTQQPQTIIIQEPLQKVVNKKYTISYPIKNILNNEFNKIHDNIKNIVVCIYRTNTNTNNYFTNYPYLEYLLFKYSSEEKQKHLRNTCVFPFIKYNKNKLNNYNNLLTL